MGKLLVLASGVVKGARGQSPRAVSAYLVLSAGAKSRIFKVRGAGDAPAVEELAAATTIDRNRFQHELQADLQPALDAARAEGIPAHIELPMPDWVCAFVRRHLKATEGIDVT